MDLRITIKDEDGAVLMDKLTIYQDGSDAAGVARIKYWLINTFIVEGEIRLEDDIEVIDNCLQSDDNEAHDAWDRIQQVLEKSNVR